MELPWWISKMDSVLSSLDISMVRIRHGAIDGSHGVSLGAVELTISGSVEADRV